MSSLRRMSNTLHNKNVANRKSLLTAAFYDIIVFIQLYRLVKMLKSILEQYGVELPQLAEFPASIKLDQAVAAWKHIVHYYAKRH